MSYSFHSLLLPGSQRLPIMSDSPQSLNLSGIPSAEAKGGKGKGKSFSVDGGLVDREQHHREGNNGKEDNGKPGSSTIEARISPEAEPTQLTKIRVFDAAGYELPNQFLMTDPDLNTVNDSQGNV